jgi:DNA-binding transcriptional ArsR family regulator
MPVQAGFARIAALLADPAREVMLVELADGRALPAGELAKAAGITPQSASGHLRKMVEGGIVSVWSQGRFRYFRLASEQVGAALETLASVAQTEPRRTVSARTWPVHLVAARRCYTHIAGRLGVALADALVKSGYVTIEGDSVTLTDRGLRWVEMTGLPLNAYRAGPGNLRLCLDWTERRFHFAGSVPSAILQYLLETRCLERGDERSLIVTRSARRGSANWGWTRTARLRLRGTARHLSRPIAASAAPSPPEDQRIEQGRRSGRISEKSPLNRPHDRAAAEMQQRGVRLRGPHRTPALTLLSCRA